MQKRGQEQTVFEEEEVKCLHLHIKALISASKLQNSFCLDPYLLTYYFLREASEKQLLFQIRMNASPHSLNPLAPSPHRTIFLEFFTDILSIGDPFQI